MFDFFYLFAVVTLSIVSKSEERTLIDKKNNTCVDMTVENGHKLYNLHVHKTVPTKQLTLSTMFSNAESCSRVLLIVYTNNIVSIPGQFADIKAKGCNSVGSGPVCQWLCLCENHYCMVGLQVHAPQPLSVCEIW